MTTTTELKTKFESALNLLVNAATGCQIAGDERWAKIFSDWVKENKDLVEKGDQYQETMMYCSNCGHEDAYLDKNYNRAPAAEVKKNGKVYVALICKHCGGQWVAECEFNGETRG